MLPVFSVFSKNGCNFATENYPVFINLNYLTDIKRNWIFGTLGIVVLLIGLLAFAKGGIGFRRDGNSLIDTVEAQTATNAASSIATQDVNMRNIDDFACNLFRSIYTQRQDNGSIVVSPLGVGFLLGMLNDGADGKTRQQITNVLGLDGYVGIFRK